jgi:hypothetical protein
LLKRRVVAELARFAVRFDPPVLHALSAEFGCTPQAIQRDLRAVQSEGRLDFAPAPVGQRAMIGWLRQQN